MTKMLWSKLRLLVVGRRRVEVLCAAVRAGASVVTTTIVTSSRPIRITIGKLWILTARVYPIPGLEDKKVPVCDPSGFSHFPPLPSLHSLFLFPHFHLFIPLPSFFIPFAFLLFCPFSSQPHPRWSLAPKSSWGVWGIAVSSSSASGQSPATKCILVHFRWKSRH